MCCVFFKLTIGPMFKYRYVFLVNQSPNYRITSTACMDLSKVGTDHLHSQHYNTIIILARLDWYLCDRKLNHLSNLFAWHPGCRAKKIYGVKIFKKLYIRINYLYKMQTCSIQATLFLKIKMKKYKIICFGVYLSVYTFNVHLYV